MRIGFINPKGTIFSKNEKLAAFLEQSVTMGSFRHFWSAPCLGLLTIAAYCPDDWELIYEDENMRELNPNNEFDIVCISAMTVQITRAYEIAEMYRGRGALVVIGGIHATVCAEEALLHGDVVIAGEGEKLFPIFISDYINHSIKRLYRDDESGSFDMSRCITPAYRLLKGFNYPLINLYTTRGCPRKCSFCCASNVYGVKYRRKTNKQIITEIENISRNFPDKLLLFADDNVFIRRKESKELLRRMVPLQVRWIAQTDISITEDKELLTLMAQAGCQWIVIGFESVSKASLKGIDEKSFKYRYQREYAERIKTIQSYGIGIYGTFIVGLDGDTPDIFDSTAEFIQENRLYGANITVPTPLPGTQLREEMQGRITDKGWEYYTLWDVVVEPESMSKDSLEAGLYRIYQQLAASENASQRLKNLLIQRRNISRKGIKSEKA